ncbi:hypothetical protein KR054_005934, partial [Drosophila jambulina]
KIIDYLSLEVQLQLWQATESTSRLSLAILKAWRRRDKHCLHWSQSFSDNEVVFHSFLNCISSTAVEVELTSFSLLKMEVLRHHCFYDTRKLVYSREGSDLDDDTDMDILVKCFPLIESLKIRGNGSGRHVARWKHLQRLEIIEASENWQTKYFQKVCLECPLKILCVRWRESEEDAFVESISKLQQLQELHLEFNQLSTENTRKLLSLPKLRKFRFDEFENVEDLLDAVAEIRGQDVVALTCNENFWLYLNPNRFENVRKIAIIDEGVVEGIWCAQSFNEALGEFPHLAELYLENASVWSDGEEFWQRLKLIYLTKLDLDDEKFFQFSEVTIEKALSQRENPLVIHFVKTKCKDLVSVVLFKAESINYLFNYFRSQFFRHPKLKVYCISMLDNNPNL